MKKEREEYKYEAYIYSEPNFMVLENESIIDISIIEESKKLIIDYNDYFFEFNLRNCKSEFSIVSQCYNRTGQFLEQIQINADNFIIQDNRVIFDYDQKISNKAFASISQKWESASDIYKRERFAYYRQSKIEKILK